MPDIEIVFATNRDTSGRDTAPKFGDRFQSMGPHVFRIGRATVAHEGNEYAVRKKQLLPEKLTGQGQKLGSLVLFEELRRRMREEGRDALVLIHGFASTIDSSLERGAQLAEEYLIGTKAPIVFVFAWPSDGRTTPPTKYHDDRTDAKLSGPAIARAMLRLIEFLRGGGGPLAARGGELGLRDRQAVEPCDCKLHLVAHSMGNYALRAAVQELREQLGTDRIPRLFDEVFLMAADEDDDALGDVAKLSLLPRLASAVHVYHSRNDRALVVSDVSKGNPDRLGSRGPRRIEGLDPRIFLVDCQNVDETGAGDGGHQYYRSRREVIDDVRQVLAGVPPDRVAGRRALNNPRTFMIEKDVATA